MRGVRAQIASLMATLALAGCIQTGDQVATGPRSDLDAMAYGISPGDTVLVGERWF